MKSDSIIPWAILIIKACQKRDLLEALVCFIFLLLVINLEENKLEHLNRFYEHVSNQV